MPIRNRADFNNLREERLRLEVVIPVFQELGARGLVDNHGTAELGKDILGWFESPTGSPSPFAVVLKAGDLSGESLKEAAAQVNQAFRTEFTTGMDTTKKRAKTVYVITNGRVPNSSEDRLRSLIEQQYDEHTEVWNGDELWNKWTSLFPVTIDQLQQAVREHLADISDEAIYAEAWVGENSQGIAIKVKDASKLTDAHVKGNVRLEFPDTEAGREARLEFLEHMRTGSPLSLSSEFATVRLPEILEKVSQQFGQQQFRIDRVEITSADSDVRFPVKISIQNDRGDAVTLDYIDWRMLRAGTEQVTFVNDQQNIPIRFQMTFDVSGGMAHYDFMMSDKPASATWIVKMMDLERCLSSDATMTITMLNTGAEMLSTSHTPSDADIDEEEYRFYQELAAIESTIKQPLFIPTTELTDEDHTNLITMRALLRSPVINATWKDANIIYLDDGSGETELAALLSGQESTITNSGISTLLFAGREISLGRFTRVMESARLENLDEVKHLLHKIGDPVAKELHLKLIPGSSNVIRTTFLDWIDAPAAARYRKQHDIATAAEDV